LTEAAVNLESQTNRAEVVGRAAAEESCQVIGAHVGSLAAYNRMAFGDLSLTAAMPP